MTAPAATPFDAVVDVVAGRSAVVVRHVPHTLTVFTTHFPLFPVLPGVLLLDDLVAAARLAVDGVGADPVDLPVWRLASVGRIRYRRFVSPGDVLEIRVDVTERSRRRAVCRGEVRVDGQRVASVQTLVLQEGEL